MPHKPPFPEREARRIEGGGARDGLDQGSSAAAAGYAALDSRRIDLFKDPDLYQGFARVEEIARERIRKHW
jgi:hypothetical protein